MCIPKSLGCYGGRVTCVASDDKSLMTARRRDLAPLRYVDAGVESDRAAIDAVADTLERKPEHVETNAEIANRRGCEMQLPARSSQ